MWLFEMGFKKKKKLKITPLKSIKFIVCINSWFLFITEYYSIVWMYQFVTSLVWWKFFTRLYGSGEGTLKKKLDTQSPRPSHIK